MLARPPLVGLTLGPQVWQAFAEVPFLFLDPADLGGDDVGHCADGGGVPGLPVGQLGSPPPAFGPGNARSGEVALDAGDVVLGLSSHSAWDTGGRGSGPCRQPGP